MSEAHNHEEWDDYQLSESDEIKLRRRFRDADDPFRIVIICSKWLTGFDAPIEGVIYVDKPMRQHTLYQAICRTNRPLHHDTIVKIEGLVVDYIGNGATMCKSAVRDDLPDRNVLIQRFLAALARCEAALAGVDRHSLDQVQLVAAQAALTDPDVWEQFALDIRSMQHQWDVLWPDAQLVPRRESYRFVCQIYSSMCPKWGDLWRPLWPATLALIGDNITTAVPGRWPDGVLLNAKAVRRLQQISDEAMQLAPDLPEISAADAMDMLQEQLRVAILETHAEVYITLAARLEAVRQSLVDSAEKAEEALLRIAEIAEAKYGADVQRAAGSDLVDLVDWRLGAMAQIVTTQLPADMEPHYSKNVATDIDRAMASELAFRGWERSDDGRREVRKRLYRILRDNGGLSLTLAAPLFDFVLANYHDWD